jgi:hypothetical protein
MHADTQNETDHREIVIDRGVREGYPAKYAASDGAE